jgi:hypothetical protein
MMSRAKIYQSNAAQCEREGDRATSPALKSKYRGVAQQWRDMAEDAKKNSRGLDAVRLANPQMAL